MIQVGKTLCRVDTCEQSLCIQTNRCHWEHYNKKPIAKWIPDDNQHQARRIGKLGEETNELGAVLFRIQIQGIDAIDPASGKTNRQRFIEEMADVTAQIELSLEFFGIDANEGSFFDCRVQDKKRQMGEWEAHFKPEQIE